MVRENRIRARLRQTLEMLVFPGAIALAQQPLKDFKPSAFIQILTSSELLLMAYYYTQLFLLVSTYFLHS